jgi:hypothetical protein
VTMASNELINTLVKLSRSVVCVCAAMCISGCVSWMDSEMIERDGAEEWVDVALAMTEVEGGSIAVKDLAVYSAMPASAVRAGLLPPTNLGESGVSPVEVVLGPGDVVDLVEGASLQSFRRRADIELEQVGPAGVVVVTLAFHGGRCEVIAHESVSLVEKRRIDRIIRKPISYLLDGEESTPEMVDSAQAVLWVTLPPVELGRLITRSFGGCFVTPTGFEETLIDSFYKRAEGDPVRAHLRPVAGLAYTWELALAGSDAPVKLAGVVATQASGRGVIPVWEHAQVVRENIDFSTVARLTIRSADAGASEVSKELTVDLLQLTLEAPR